MEFKEGGAFDFASIFERLKERLRQAVDVARESGAEEGGLNMNNVHLDDLPAYEESRQHTRVPDPLPSPPINERRASGTATGGSAIAAPQPTSPQRTSPMASSQAASSQSPSDPPPGYEEAQRDSVVEELERQARRMSSD